MPREEAYFTYGYPKMGHGRSHITAEEAAGIGILIVILGILLLIGCWYCRRRSGYKSLKEDVHVRGLVTRTANCLFRRTVVTLWFPMLHLPTRNFLQRSHHHLIRRESQQGP
ncbi:melanoma antigen recognized by T-cells 1 isoform X2 [Equus asinus]|uniref:melanoma antigen recognized by T-cells 1 isoform X2 n=1 Tax=Equus asinus TaxID=9793 RepID=UPI0038F7BFED